MHDGTFTVWKVGQNSIKGVFKQINILWLGKSNCQTETVHIYLWGFACKVKENKLYQYNVYNYYIYIYIYVCMCICICSLLWPLKIVRKCS